MNVIDRVGEVHNNRVVVSRAPDSVCSRKRFKVDGSPTTASQRARNWTVRCLSCGKETITTWQAVRLKGCFPCACAKSRKDDAHVVATSRFHSMKSGARQRNLRFDMTVDDVKSVMTKPCHYCGDIGGNCAKKRWRTFRYNGADRVDSALGYSPSNVVPCCWICNRAKREMPYAEFVAWLERVTAFRQQQERAA